MSILDSKIPDATENDGDQRKDESRQIEFLHDNDVVAATAARRRGVVVTGAVTGAVPVSTAARYETMNHGVVGDVVMTEG